MSSSKNKRKSTDIVMDNNNNHLKKDCTYTYNLRSSEQRNKRLKTDKQDHKNVSSVKPVKQESETKKKAFENKAHVTSSLSKVKKEALEDAKLIILKRIKPVDYCFECSAGSEKCGAVEIVACDALHKGVSSQSHPVWTHTSRCCSKPSIFRGTYIQRLDEKNQKTSEFYYTSMEAESLTKTFREFMFPDHCKAKRITDCLKKSKSKKSTSKEDEDDEDEKEKNDEFWSYVSWMYINEVHPQWYWNCVVLYKDYATAMNHIFPKTMYPSRPDFHNVGKYNPEKSTIDDAYEYYADDCEEEGEDNDNDDGDYNDNDDDEEEEEENGDDLDGFIVSSSDTDFEEHD